MEVLSVHYRNLGTSNMMVSEIALGSWLTYSGGVEKERSIACVRRALDLGVTLIDTANIYGRGAAETLLGEALTGVDRSSYILATRLLLPDDGDGSRAVACADPEATNASLARLKTDHVDLYQCHRYDLKTPLEETMQALSDVVRQGKVRFIGFSEWPVDKIRKAINMAGVEKFVSSQPQYSLLRHESESAVFPLCPRTASRRSYGRHWRRVY